MSVAPPVPDPEAASDTPDVSVIVIVFNDAARLPTAVRSVLRQTLRKVEVIICDDASTDSTPAVAEQLCQSDSRVRYVRLTENSGGCGAPRNAGLEVARGANVIFLDSDDRLERHACKNLLEAREDADADFSMGLVRREYMQSGKQTRWYPQFFEERRVLHGIGDDLALIEDTLSVNKLYRKDFLTTNDLAFPEDVHYEDQVFSLRAYTRAERIAIIPETVYIWRVFTREKTRSITNQRAELRNILDRLEVNRRLDALITEADIPDLQRVKDLKFLQHDMRLYLADSIDGDAGVAAQVLAEAEEYFRLIPQDRFEQLPYPLRAAYAMALRHDVEGVRQAMLFDRRNILALRIDRSGGAAYFANNDGRPAREPGHADSEPVNRWLLADDSPILTAPVGSYHLLHEVTAARREGSRVVLEGRSFDALGKLDGADSWDFTLVVTRKGTSSRTRVPLRITAQHNDFVQWSATLDASLALPPLSGAAVAELTMRTRIGEHTAHSPVLWHPTVADLDMPLPRARRTALALDATIGSGHQGNVRIEVLSHSDLRYKVAKRLAKRYLPAIRRRVRGNLTPARKQAALERLFAALRHLPLDENAVVFEANLGTIYGDSPKYVYEALRRERPQMRATWVLPAGHPPPHEGVDVVQRGTPAYVMALARAKYWVDNQTFPGYVRKRPDQRYLQTWHGIPLKKMGKDEPHRPLAPQQPDRGVGAWDELVVPNPYFETTFVPAYEYRKGLVRYGTPRNDPLVDGSLDRDTARAALDLPPGAKVVLYAPTFRQDNRTQRHAVIAPFDVGEVLDALDDDTFILLRPHYLNRIAVPASARHTVLDVSRIEDVNVLYAAADVLITDYSSVMFDYALLRRPIIFYTHDYSQYLASRGTYLDLLDIAPGPFATTTDELIPLLQRALSDPAGHQATVSERYDTFLQDYCGREDGQASRRAVDALLGGPAGEPSEPMARPAITKEDPA